MMQPSDIQDDQGLPATSPAGSRRTRVVVALLAAVVLLGGAAAVAVWAMTGGPAASDQVQAQPGASTATSGTPTSTSTLATSVSTTAEVLGRNVFAPLVDTAAVVDVPGDGDMPGSVEVTPGGFDQAGPVAAPATETVFVPADPVTVTRSQVGPTTTVPGPTQTVAGPTQTVAGPTATVTTTTGFAFTVAVVGVADPAVDDSNATFTVNGASSTVGPGAAFGSIFTYVDYDAATGLVSFTHDTTLVQAAVGRTLGLQ